MEAGQGTLTLTMNDTQTVSGKRRLEATSRAFAAVLAFTMLAPLFATMRPANAQLFGRKPAQPKQGMSTRNKVLLVGGAALLYYLYKKHQAKAAEQTNMNPGNGQVAARPQQLYRSKNGGIYYRDASGKPVWLTVPNQPVQVPASEVARYAPDYQRYRGPAPAAPSGYRTQPFGDYDTDAMSSGNGSVYPTGPRRN